MISDTFVFSAAFYEHFGTGRDFHQLAHDLAKRSEQGYRFELGLADSSFIEFGYWDSLKKGLLCGEKLSLDLKRMDSSFLDKNRREFEIPAAQITGRGHLAERRADGVGGMGRHGQGRHRRT